MNSRVMQSGPSYRRLFQRNPQRLPASARRGFTILEVLVAMAVLTLLMMLVLSMTDRVSKIWKGTTTRMEAFEAARSGFDQITSKLSQAVLNPYWDYTYDTNGNPTKYDRQSELQFLITPTVNLNTTNPAIDAAHFPTHGLFFQAPTGMAGDNYVNLSTLLNAWGYYVEFGDDSADRPPFIEATASLTPRYRYRLKEWEVPSEKLALYSFTSGSNGASYLGADSLQWINLAAPAPHTLAENVIALVAIARTPENSKGEVEILSNNTYGYNSRTDLTTTPDADQKHQLPPMVEVVMVAIDEDSAARWQRNAAAPHALLPEAPPIFTNPNNLEEDLDTLKAHLDENRVRYIVLRANVTIRAGRWSHN